MMFERALRGDEAVERRSFDPRVDRKTLQLCRQVQRALMLALSGECADEVLHDVYVESVEPMGSASQLLVRIVMSSAAGVPSLEVLGRLNSRSARLRAIVAQSICRKRVPNLSFVAVAPRAGSSDGGPS
jgi:ribosome-binding factor A